jgi:hypothetical protein
VTWQVTQGIGVSTSWASGADIGIIQSHEKRSREGARPRVRCFGVSCIEGWKLERLVSRVAKTR